MSSTPFSELIKQAAEAKFTVIPVNEYAIVARDCSATKSSTNKDMLKLSVKVLVGPFKDSSVITQQTLSPENPAAVAIFLKFLDAFGLDEEFLAALPPREDGGPNMSAVASAIKGRAAMAEVGIHEWQGEDRNDIKRFKKPTAEQQAAIQEALEAAGVEGNVFGAPSAGPSDPFAASAPAGGDQKADASF